MLENSIADIDICKESILKPFWVPNLGTALLHKTFPLLGRTLLTAKYINRNPNDRKGSVLEDRIQGMVAQPNSGRGAVSFPENKTQDTYTIHFHRLPHMAGDTATKRLRITTDSKFPSVSSCKFKNPETSLWLVSDGQAFTLSQSAVRT